MVAIPGMVGFASFELTVIILLAKQAVMLNIICARELPVGEQVVNDQERDDAPAE